MQCVDLLREDGRVVPREDGELLAGGSKRRVVRVGSTVRIPPHEQSGYVADLLRHLERVGFDGAPRRLGRTEDGYELLTYVDGTVPGDPPYNLDDGQLRAAAGLVLRFHDAVAGTPLCHGAETVCHGDLGPHNTVFRDGLPVALIDWDDDVHVPSTSRTPSGASQMSPVTRFRWQSRHGAWR